MKRTKDFDGVRYTDEKKQNHFVIISSAKNLNKNIEKIKK